MSGNLRAGEIGKFCQLFDRVYCISLQKSADRRAYISEYFDEIGIERYEFFNATDQTDKIVSDYYDQGLVATFPPCFRCHKLTCDDEACNNILIRPQVATFISYLRLWKEIVDRDVGTALILEDDVCFTEYAGDISEAVGNCLTEINFKSDNPVLLRLGWAWSDEHINPVSPTLLNSEVRMSNPCHAITNAFAKKLVSNFKKIDKTVDNYQHRQVAATEKAFTFTPPMAYELSWIGAVDSLIHPKSVRLQYLQHYSSDDTAKIKSTAQAVDKHFSHILYRDLLVVGHPHCGSDYMSKLLQSAGLDVGHEKMGKYGISSWMFAVDDDVPYALDKYSVSRKMSYFKSCIQYVRDPRSAIPSIMHETKHSELSFQYRQKHIKDKFDIDLNEYVSDIDQAVVSYIYWNRLIEKEDIDLVLRIEDAEEKLLNWLLEKELIDARPEEFGLLLADAENKKSYKEGEYEKTQIDEQEWSRISPNLLIELNTQCQLYGYNTFDLN